MAQWVKGKVIDVEHWTDTLFRIKIKAPIAAFIPGQYAKLALLIDGKRVTRAYSYVNAPSDNHPEFYLVKIPKGQLSPHLHQLSVNEEIMLSEEARGFFVLSEIPSCDTLWMLATGTGIGPYLSILQAGEDLARFKHIVLVHAARLSCDLNYLPLMQQLKKCFNGRLHIQTVVSREKTATSLHGRIPALIENHLLEKTVGLDINHQSHVMLCGNPQMVRDTQKILQDTRQMQKNLRGQPGHISSEQYW